MGSVGGRGLDGGQGVGVLRVREVGWWGQEGSCGGGQWGRGWWSLGLRGGVSRCHLMDRLPKLWLLH